MLGRAGPGWAFVGWNSRAAVSSFWGYLGLKSESGTKCLWGGCYNWNVGESKCHLDKISPNLFLLFTALFSVFWVINIFL